ncbi:MAG TPA: glycosyl hydrolase family 28 protein [Prolixibacteraceae bacterium]|nr:glycosyl hydrolase family 28 protein [Prolixibacteraceae bacterium]
MNRILIFIFLLGLIFQNNVSAQQKSTVYTIGDSTVKNGRGDGSGGLWGWGDAIVQYFDTTKINVENDALGGTSSRTYQSKGLWNEVLKKLKPGDFVLMQFGHNDNGPLNDTLCARGTIKGVGEESREIDNMITKQHEVVHSYGWYLRKVVRETKAKGAIPVIITPIPRNDWKNGKIVRTPASYPDWAMEVAKQEKIQFVDLNKHMSDKLDTYGESEVTGRFYFSRDHTHTSAQGAVLSSSLIVDGLKTMQNFGLTKYLLENSKVVFPVKKRVFIIGDSTVANGNDSIVGWGREFPAFFDTSRVIILNIARGGRSSRTFMNEGLWNEILPQLHKGDFVLMQFGHNDGAKPDAEKFRGSLRGIGDETQLVTRPDGTQETVHTYGWYMKKYILDTKAKGAEPIVLSMIPRNEWKDGKVERASEMYGKWAKEVAEQTDAFFIDLNELVAKKYEEMGSAKVKQYFPGDHTHTNMAGAQLNAQTVAEGVKSLRTCKLGGYFTDDANRSLSVKGKSKREYPVTQFGASGDGQTLNTKSIQMAIDKCAADGGGVVVISQGAFMSGAIFLKQGVDLRIDKGGVLKGTTNMEDYSVVATRWEGVEQDWTTALVNIFNMNNFTLSGEGKIDGSGEQWVELNKNKKSVSDNPRLAYGRPRLIAIQNCKNAEISGLSLKNQACWGLFILYSENIEVKNLTIRAEHNIPMSDGIDVDSSKDIHIAGCDIDVNDDCIAIKSGKDEDGRRVNRPCEDILIDKCTFRYGHGGVSMGSEMSGGIRNVTIQNCVMEADNWAPIRFKCQPSRGGVVENITYRDIVLKDTRKAFEFNMEWRMVNPKPASDPLPVFRNVKIINVSGTTATVGNMHGLKDSPIKNVVFENCNITAKRGFVLDNVEDVDLSGLKIQVSEGEPVIWKK